MKLYRFSPIQTKDSLMEAIAHIHFQAHQLCMTSFGEYLPVAGNVGVFCHYQDEFNYLNTLRKELTTESENFNQKYFKLKEPITVDSTNGIPAAVYEYLYIRKPDPYRHHAGDIDFYLEPTKYDSLKQEMTEGKQIKGARVFSDERLDMIELYNPDIDVISYVSNKMMRDLVRETKE